MTDCTSLRSTSARAALFAAALASAAAAPLAQIVYPSVVLKTINAVPATDGALNDSYGFAVGLAGDRAVIGARSDDDVFGNSGSVYVRDRNLGGPEAWGQVTKLHASDPELGASFGTAVDIDGGWIVATAPASSNAALVPGVGAVYVFTNPGLAFVNKMQPTVVSTGFGMGNAVAVDAAMGQTIVGARSWWSTFPGEFFGRAFVYDVASGAPGPVLAGDTTVNEEFGTSVAIGDGHYAVGAPGNGGSKGAVFVFAGGTGAFLHKIIPADGLSGDRFGTCVSIDGGLVAIGSPGNDAPSLDSGAIYIHSLATGLLVKKVTPTYSSGGFGTTVALAGNELYSSQDGTTLSGTVQTCGSIYQMRWDHGYTVVSHVANSIGGLCSNHLNYNLAVDNGTFVAGDGYFAVGLGPSTGNAFFGKRVPLALAADRKITVAANPLDFTVRAGEPSLPCVLGIVALDGIPIAPVVIAAGLAGGTGQWTKHYPSTTGTAITVTFQAAAFDASMSLLLSNTFNVQFL